MLINKYPITILGDGGWGTTLALHLHHLGHRVTLWGAFPAYVKTLLRERENVKFLPGIPLPKSLTITADLEAAVGTGTMVVLAIPSQHLRSVLRRLTHDRFKHKTWVSVGKGLEHGTYKRLSQVITEELGHVPLAALSGPNIAREIATGHPASAVVASPSLKTATHIQHVFTGPRFRVYTSTDVIGVELGGALKNSIAIAAGIGDGLGFGANAKAALISRGIVEMARLGVALGAEEETFWGLSGLGDLITTCLGGRNRWLGEQLGKGKRLPAVLASTPMVIEGVETTKAAVAKARRVGVELPIIEQVHAMLFRGKNPRRALQALMTRSRKIELLHA